MWLDDEEVAPLVMQQRLAGLGSGGGGGGGGGFGRRGGIGGSVCGEAWMSGRLLLALVVRAAAAKRTARRVGSGDDVAATSANAMHSTAGQISRAGDVFFRKGRRDAAGDTADDFSDGKNAAAAVVTSAELHEWRRLLASSKVVEHADGFSGGSKVRFFVQRLDRKNSVVFYNSRICCTDD